MSNGKCLNSFSIVLMLIAYLQHKKVLPCLQSFGETKRITYTRYLYNKKSFSYGCTLETDLKFEIPPVQNLNLNMTKNPKELLIGFFEFYSKGFDFGKYAICIS